MSRCKATFRSINIRYSTDMLAAFLKYLIAWLCIVSLVFQSGCASTALRPPSSVVPEQEIAEIGTVGVATARFDPAVRLEDINSGKGTGAAKGAGKGALAGANLFSGVPCAGIDCVLVLFLMAAGATVGAVVGTVSGAVEAEPAEKVEDTKAKAQAVFAEFRFQDSVRDHVVKYAMEEAEIPVVAFAETGPASPDEQFNYQALASQKVDNILEVSILSVGTEGGFLDPDPPLSLVIRARARLVRVKDGKVLTVLNYAFRSEPHKISEWAANNNLQRFNDALERGYQQIAEEVVDEMFLLYYPLRPKLEVQSEGTQQIGNQGEPREHQASTIFPPYVLGAEYPEVRHCFFCKYRTWGNFEFVKIKELQPTLRWKPFPWPDDLGTSGAQKQVTDVTYELKVYLLGKQIYLRKGLPTPYHQLEQPLEPCAYYSWTVRARFKLDSHYRVTEWAGTYPLGADPWDLRRPERGFVGGGKLYPKFLESSWSYYLFRTSAQDTDKNCPC